MTRRIWQCGTSKDRTHRHTNSRLDRVLMQGCCVRARIDHSGFGNWLYIAVEVALVAAANNCTFVLPAVMHRWFHLPPRVRPISTQTCQDIRCMQAASQSPGTRRRATMALSARTFEDARAQTFRELFARPRAAPRTPVAFRTAVHLRTVSDLACQTHVDIRNCQRACLRDRALECVVRHAQPPVLILSDTKQASARLRRLFHEAHIRDVWDESSIVDARNHSGSSRRAAHQTLLLWSAFSDAPVRFGSGISTFSKSALLARPAIDFVVDTRCSKAHRSDGDLYTCRRALLRSDLVRL